LSPQQLSVKASNTIYSRFKALFNSTKSNVIARSPKRPKQSSFPKPNEILNLSDEVIRTAGISFQKISYIKNIATAFANDEIDIKALNKSTDEEVIINLTKLKGVGKWTAEMTLIFTLNRPDVFSIGDLGLRHAVEKLYGISDQKKILKLSEKWQPHRSTASWYLWRSLENKT